MAPVLDLWSIPESTRQTLLASTYKMTAELLKDPAMRAECDEWKRKRKAAMQAAR